MNFLAQTHQLVVPAADAVAGPGEDAGGVKALALEHGVRVGGARSAISSAVALAVKGAPISVPEPTPTAASAEKRCEVAGWKVCSASSVVPIMNCLVSMTADAALTRLEL